MLAEPLSPSLQKLRLDDGRPVEWAVSKGYVDYAAAEAFMEARVAAIAAGEAHEMVWLLEHPPLYTAGTSAKAGDLVDARFPVFDTGRGGQYTYHGPGQRVAYVMLDLSRRRRDLRAFVATLEAWVIGTLASFNVVGEQREDRVGVWVRRPDKPTAPDGTPAEDKIAAIGVRVQRGVTMHGFALNCDNSLLPFSQIVPCGISDAGVTTLSEMLGRDIRPVDVVDAVSAAFQASFAAPVSGSEVAA